MRANFAQSDRDTLSGKIVTTDRMISEYQSGVVKTQSRLLSYDSLDSSVLADSLLSLSNSTEKRTRCDDLLLVIDGDFHDSRVKGF